MGLAIGPSRREVVGLSNDRMMLGPIRLIKYNVGSIQIQENLLSILGSNVAQVRLEIWITELGGFPTYIVQGRLLYQLATHDR